MATRPDLPPPDRIQPQAPPETPITNPPAEHPFVEPPEIRPDLPNIDAPGDTPPELVPPATPGQAMTSAARDGISHVLRTRMSRWSARFPPRAASRRR